MDGYLSYVVRLRDRIANSSHQDGVTKWALGVAILYLLFQSLPILIDLLYKREHLYQYLYTFTHTLGFLIGCMYVYSVIRSNSKFSLRDYRYKTLSNNDIFREFISDLFSVSLYLILNLSYAVLYFAFSNDAAGIFASEGSEFYFTLFFAFFGFAYICYIIFFPIHSVLAAYSKSEFPRKLTLQIKGGGLTVGLKLFIASILILMIFGNLYFLVFPNLFNSIETYKESVIFSAQLSLALIGITYFIRSINNQDALTTLENLERDIVLHEIAENEIKLRLQEYFGYEINEFILQKISDFRHYTKATESLVAGYDDFKLSYLGIPDEYEFERKKRLDEYLAKLESFNTEREMKFKLFKEFLDHLLTETPEAEAKNLIRNYTSEIESIAKEISNQLSELLEKARELKN